MCPTPAPSVYIGLYPSAVATARRDAGQRVGKGEVDIRSWCRSMRLCGRTACRERSLCGSERRRGNHSTQRRERRQGEPLWAMAGSFATGSPQARLRQRDYLDQLTGSAGMCAGSSEDGLAARVSDRGPPFVGTTMSPTSQLCPLRTELAPRICVRRTSGCQVEGQLRQILHCGRARPRCAPRSSMLTACTPRPQRSANCSCVRFAVCR